MLSPPRARIEVRPEKLGHQNRLAWRTSGKAEQRSPGSRPLAGFDLIIIGRF
jgi:hypothetical protein